MFDRIVKKMGRPRLGRNGTRQVSITVEADLLDQADGFAAAAGMNRSELISQGLRRMLASA
jgi:metal-responsive CopG/Arc/MetJ family transcriptional regulator